MEEALRGISSFNLVASELYDDNLCNSYPEAVELNNGSVDFSSFCFDWDGQTIDFPYSPFTFKNPSCSDTGRIIDY